MRKIYFVRAEGIDRIKIGCCRDLPSRVLALQEWLPFRLLLVAHAAGDGRDENYLHALFGQSRVAGEWFTSSPRLEELIAVVACNGALPLWARAPEGWRIQVSAATCAKISAGQRRLWESMSAEEREGRRQHLRAMRRRKS